MNNQDCIDKISEALASLEQRGEIVLTSVFPEKVSQDIFNAAIKSWLEANIDSQEPIEIGIPYLLEEISNELVRKFSLQVDHAKETTNEYYTKWLQHCSMKEIAEIFYHETPSEMANRAYYSLVLGNEDNRDMKYIDWRMNTKNT
ncbi:hypothetical protein [Celerinatantimonas sp. MCCC 1A17872]|uniref:hypothetical protein n=1 Tax=Celerinatantimonas sp. MCCC 1A17872 TaxID=3177514 RepID=UPI0038C488B3